MRIPGTGWLRQALGHMRVRRPRQALILMYHRVAEADSDPWGLCVSPAHFAEHLGVLQQHGTCIRLKDLVHALQNGRLPLKALVLTFDDGYADNYHNAKPLLERYGIPATFFLTTGQLGSRREFWWDELGRLLLQPGMLPERLQLTIEGKAHEWHLGDDACYSEESCRQHRSWRAWEEAPSERHVLYLSLWEKLYELSESEKQRVLSELRAWAGVHPRGRSTRRTLSTDEVVSLGQHDLIEQGAHTATHPPLALLPTDAQLREIQQSKTRLVQLLGRPVTSFSYPHGHYTAETVSLVRQAGFTCACSTTATPIQPSSDCFQLPRMQVMDWDGKAFNQQLNAWLAATDES